METTVDHWIAPYYLRHDSDKWQISRARVGEKWRYALWTRRGQEWHRVGIYDTLEQAKEQAT